MSKRTGRPKSIFDEWTYRDDLTGAQKYRRRHPEKVKAPKKKKVRKKSARK